MVNVKLSSVFAAAAALLLASCVSPQESGVQVIVGAKLEAGPGIAPVPYSIVVIQGGKFKAVGPQGMTPFPNGAEITRGYGMTIEPIPGGGPIQAGRPADLVLKGDHDRIMRAGVWVE